ncbi:MAG: hypothetical protein ATN33_04545 [Epulopiscium sp. Nele67-Bin001]|nr:MAG: hypothetical protein BEN18_07550 [Epulopiscium sp. Nuni2H_MBin001]OON94349.1 MAG: hypothetical protein ATN33_04545 [Epulopiscium sp. Nele67-Bin001]
MALYSILPVTEDVEKVEYVEIDYNGHHVLAAVTPEGYKLERLTCSNFENYLDEGLQPGTLLDSRLINKIM